jgi:kynureninase
LLVSEELKQYAAESQIKFHHFDPKESLIMVEPRVGEHVLRTEDIVEVIRNHDFALVLLPGVQYASGQVLDIEAITQVARESVRNVFLIAIPT